jgi:hypothetical protein
MAWRLAYLEIQPLEQVDQYKSYSHLDNLIFLGISYRVFLIHDLCHLDSWTRSKLAECQSLNLPNEKIVYAMSVSGFVAIS